MSAAAVTPADLAQLAALAQAGRFAQLEQQARALIGRDPASGLLWNLLAAALRLQGKEALPALQQAAVLLPRDAEAQLNLGKALAGLERLEEAVGCYRQALALRPDHAQTCVDLGVALRTLGHSSDAAAYGRRALELMPQLPAALILVAELSADNGEFIQAEALLRRAIALEPDSAEAWAGLVTLRRMTLEDGPWLAEVRGLIQRTPAIQKQARLYFALGKYFDDVGEFEQAFIHYRHANELTRQFRPAHDRVRLEQAGDLLIRRFDRHWLEQVRSTSGQASGQAPSGVRPVFIVGMPRSGTTLAEQILASHPQVFGAGELTFWNTAAARYLSGAPAAGGSGTSALAEEYLRQLAGLSGNAAWVVDKMPGNFMSLGLIHAALPEAVFIHMQRDPVDTCLSNYFQNFSAGRSYANDLGDLAHAYREYLRLLAHWRALLPGRVLLEVPYEGLVEQPQAWTRRMLEFVGLPWDPGCLDFQRTPRAVLTPSRWQVRQGISRASVGRWRHYERFIGPLRPLAGLAPTGGCPT